MTVRREWDSHGFYRLSCTGCGWVMPAVISLGLASRYAAIHACPMDCHCGESVVTGYDSAHPDRDRGMCEHCDPVRCDAYPGECGRRSK